MDRRDFLKASGILGAGVSLSALSAFTDGIPFLGAARGLAGAGAKFGALAQPRSGQTHLEALQALEAKVGRQFDVVHHRFGWKGSIVNRFTQWLAENGRLPTISWFTRLGGGPSGPSIKWADIAAGLYDDRLRQEAAAVKAAGWPAFFAWHKEPEDESAGGPDEYRVAYDHVHDVFDEVGVTNLTWVVTLTASTYRGNSGGPDAWLPGRYDLLGVDGYNRNVRGRWRSFQMIFTPARDFAVSRGRQLFVNETGSVEGSAGQKAQWFRDMDALLKGWPEVIGFSYDHESTDHVYYVDTSASSLDAFSAMGQDPYFVAA